MEIVRFQNLIRLACCQETSADSKNWSDKNPFWGQCAVVTLLAQDFFKGKILRASLLKTPFAAMRSHYRNEAHDFTLEQFGEIQLALVFEERTREYLLGNQNTLSRYLLLKQRFEELLAIS